jgi:hypothetical protein
MDEDQQAAAAPPSAFRRTVAHASPVPWPDPLSPHHALIASIGGTPAQQPGAGAADLEEVLCSPERLRYEVERASFNDAFLLSPLGHVVLGFDTAILKINLAGAEMLGISPFSCGMRSMAKARCAWACSCKCPVPATSMVCR